jgi:type IV pilus biogenesis protein CpaD/CtpE
MKLQKTVLSVFALGGVLVLGACTTKPTRTEANFGASVRQMIEAQTFDPGTRENPSAVAPEGGDGKRLEGVLEQYRTDVAKPDAVDKDIAINVGADRQ